MEKVTREVAVEEINEWLEYKKINDRKRESYQDSIDTLVDAMVDGVLTLEEDKTLVQTLKFPAESESPVTKLEYKPRLKMSTVHSHLKGVKSNDADGRLCAYVAALTGKPKGVIQSLDTEDYSTGQAIAIFFL